MTSLNACDIMVIGGGPAGSTAAFLLASRGYDVILADKRHFPRPKLCAGLLTNKTIDLIHSIFDLTAKDLTEQGLISNHIHDYRIYHRSSEIARGRLDYPFHLTDRITYDHFWLQKAVRAGTRTITGQAVRHVDPATGSVTLSNGTRIRARIIIGADGVWSIARRSIFNDVHQKRRWNDQLAMTMESRLSRSGAKTSRNYASLHFGFVPWGYAWSFPSREHRIVGIAALRRKSNQTLMAGFDRFLTSIGVQRKELGMIKGLPLPMGNYLDPPGRGRVLLVGDACGLADPLLGEGIFYAQRSAQIAAQCIIDTGPGVDHPARSYRHALDKQVLRELRWIKTFRNLLLVGGRHRRFRSLKSAFRFMPKRLEAAVQGQIPFARLFWPWVHPHR
jgi:geranylgeranyl reductase family protein